MEKTFYDQGKSMIEKLLSIRIIEINISIDFPKNKLSFN